MRKRMQPKERRDQLLAVAVELSVKLGYNRVTKEDIAKKAGVTPGLINNYFGTMTKLRRQIIRTAIRDEILEVIAQGLINNDPHAKKADAQLKQRALNAYMG